MKTKIIEIWKKYNLSILIALSIIVVGIISTMLIFNFTNKLSVKDFRNNSFTLKYDNTWSILSEKDKSVTLKHDKGSTINIEVIQIQDEYKYSTIDEMLDKLLYDIENQNKDYLLISKKEDNITKNDYKGYKLLYENNDSQAMIVVTKISDKFIIFTYEANNEYFDILLDSVQNIIYNFNIVEETFSLSHDLNVETNDILYNNSNEVTKLLNDTKQYEIASDNYHVKYSIPTSFNPSSVNSTSGNFSLNGLEKGNIRINVNISNKNIYEHLDKNKTLSVFGSYKAYKNNEKYSNFTESVDKLDSDFESFIYKNSYNYDFDFNPNTEQELYENIVLMYGLDRNHLLTIEIKSSRVAIPFELVEMIKIDSSENYSSYITSKKENGYIISELKRKKDYTSSDIEEIKLKIPDKYKEIDKGYNIYENRYYNLNYNEKLYEYDYEVNYFLTSKSTKIDSQINNINNLFSTSYGEYNYLASSGDMEINGRKYQVYDGGYTKLSGIMFTSENRIRYYVNVKVLFYELPSGGYLIIKVNGNDVQISDDVLNELTNFEI